MCKKILSYSLWVVITVAVASSFLKIGERKVISAPLPVGIKSYSKDTIHKTYSIVGKWRMRWDSCNILFEVSKNGTCRWAYESTKIIAYVGSWQWDGRVLRVIEFGKISLEKDKNSWINSVERWEIELIQAPKNDGNWESVTKIPCSTDSYCTLTRYTEKEWNSLKVK